MKTGAPLRVSGGERRWVGMDLQATADPGSDKGEEE